jgi:hypothetical protein
MARNDGFRLGGFGSGMGGTIYPGGSTGRGTGIIFRKSFKKGGEVEGKCDPQVAAFKNMIKAEAKPVKKACGGAAKVRKGMMKGK